MATLPSVDRILSDVMLIIPFRAATSSDPLIMLGKAGNEIAVSLDAKFDAQRDGSMHTATTEF